MAYSPTRQPWWLIPLVILQPDVAAGAYVRGNPLGVQMYNFARTMPVPAIRVGFGWWQSTPLVVALGLA